MLCVNNHPNVDDGRRYCSQCGAYLAVTPGNFHNDLLQLSPERFLQCVSEGLLLIHANVVELWGEAQEIARLGNRRAVGILQLFAEEEAAKALMLFDAVRCPQNFKVQFEALVKGFNDHLAKGIYVKYYGARLVDLNEARTIVNQERQRVYREGEYGEFIAPNSILYMREKRLYVSYVRHDDNNHAWSTPYPRELLFGDIVPSAIIPVVSGLCHIGLFPGEGLRVVREYWNQIHLQDPVSGDPPETDPAKNVHWGQARRWNIEMLNKWQERRRRAFENEADVTNANLIVGELLFPLYPFELTPTGNVRDLHPPDEPDWW
ncbi:MAG TPA: hypothetical protein VHA33_04910 [Candidatus Angelobacter sp.]|jgi:AbiV family abortive infection protein|nr:hypothetical protein [Candidatus Angelobacter sp.]